MNDSKYVCCWNPRNDVTLVYVFISHGGEIMNTKGRNTLGHRWLKLKFQDRCKLQTWKCKEWFTLVSSKLGMEKYFYSWADFLHDMNTKLSHSWQKQLRIWFNKAIKKSEEKGGSKRRPENIRQKLVENLVAVILLPAIAPFANVRIFMVSSCSKVYSLNS